MPKTVQRDRNASLNCDHNVQTESELAATILRTGCRRLLLVPDEVRE
jgi:hypothetical protein